MTTQVQTMDKAAAHTLAFLQLLLRDYHPRNFTIRLWNGSQWPAETKSSLFTLSLKHPGALRRMFQDTATDLSNHGIARRATDPLLTGPTFIGRYVFPDGELLPINVTLRHAEAAGFEIRDVESLREHYTLTLRHWVDRLQARRDESLQVVDESTYRVWRLYMSASAYGFAIGRLNLYQTLLVKADQGKSGLPLTRADWYTPL